MKTNTVLDRMNKIMQDSFAGLLILSILLILSLNTGCGVPKTRVQFNIGNQHFTGTFPKQFVATNVVCQIQTNGTATFSVGYMESKNDPVVIDKAAAGDVARINATAAAAQTLMETGAKLGGKVLVH